MKRFFSILLPFFFVVTLFSCSNDLSGSLIFKMPSYSDGSRAADAVGIATIDGGSSSVGGTGSTGTSTSNGGTGSVGTSTSTDGATSTDTNNQSREKLCYELEIDGPTKTKIPAKENELVRIDNLISGTYDVTCTAFYESDKSFFAKGTTSNIKVEPLKDTPAKVSLSYETLTPKIESVVVTQNGTQATVTVKVDVNQRGTVSLSGGDDATTAAGWTPCQSGLTEGTSANWIEGSAVINDENVVQPSTTSRNNFSRTRVFTATFDLYDDSKSITVEATFNSNVSPNFPKTVTFDVNLPAKNDGSSEGAAGSDNGNWTNDKIESPSVSPNFNYYETPVKIESTNGSSNNRYYFGVWPQSLKDATVSIDESTSYTINGWACYKSETTDDYYVKKNCENTYNGMTSGTEYYFKLEPIEWTAIGSGNGNTLFLSDKILYSDNYFEYKDGDNYRTISVNGKNALVYPNNYAYSKVRTWLNSLSGIEGVEDFSNSGFLGMAFTDSAKNNIVETTVKNQKSDTYKNQNNLLSGSETLNGETDTNDKVFLLSLTEATNSAYNFASYDSECSNRIKTLTDYAAACGTNSKWWLRTSDYSAPNKKQVFVVSTDGKADITVAIHGTGGTNIPVKYGLVPAMWVSVN